MVWIVFFEVKTLLLIKNIANQALCDYYWQNNSIRGACNDEFFIMG
jgi:hypothetical protein